MASASSSAARLLIRDGKSVASLLFRGCASSANLTENTGPAIRSLLLLNQRLPSQHPVFAEPFPVMQPGFGSYFTHEEAVSVVRRGKMEAGQGKRVVNNNEGSSSSEEEQETDFVEEEFDDIDMDDDDEEFDDTDEEDDDDGDEEEKAVLFKKKK
ncbi:Uncharacterized protein Rs2_20481 [Raphanus sativus]|uniref:Uncharacterized protein LOC108859927 n=1 Tax=Raphanus sativus TaxID=3726 RepID=A0A6J0NY98_RAPSA|nr:uncharacterized protein LOC108859927 [Raphanus sativus]KAJ4893687.1 Uncharacterized protein Rs2_20481 [Raphanus sativus]